MAASQTHSRVYHGIRTGSPAGNFSSIQQEGCTEAVATTGLNAGGFGYTASLGSKGVCKLQIWIDGASLGVIAADLDQTLVVFNSGVGAAGLVETSPGSWNITCPDNSNVKYEMKLQGKIATPIVTSWGVVDAGAGGQAQYVVEYTEYTAGELTPCSI